MRSTTTLPSKVDVKEARTIFDEVVASSGVIDSRVVIERDGVAVGAFVPVEDLRGLARLDAQDAEIERVFAAMSSGFEGVSEEEIEREVFKALEEVDEDRRARRARGEVV